MNRIRVVLADDHALILDGLRRILEPEMDIVAAVNDGEALVRAVEQYQPDLAVVDIAMPILNGLDAMQRLRLTGCLAKFVFITANPDITAATRALRLGAAAYVLKMSATEELLAAIHSAQQGQVYITQRIAVEVLQRLNGRPSDAVGPGLTLRERQVLQLLAEGKTFKEAALLLNVSPRTIEFHRNNIADKTGLRTTAELSRYARREGLVSDS